MLKWCPIQSSKIIMYDVTLGLYYAINVLKLT